MNAIREKFVAPLSRFDVAVEEVCLFSTNGSFTRIFCPKIEMMRFGVIEEIIGAVVRRIEKNGQKSDTNTILFSEDSAAYRFNITRGETLSFVREAQMLIRSDFPIAVAINVLEKEPTIGNIGYFFTADEMVWHQKRHFTDFEKYWLEMALTFAQERRARIELSRAERMRAKSSESFPVISFNGIIIEHRICKDIVCPVNREGSDWITLVSANGLQIRDGKSNGLVGNRSAVIINDGCSGVSIF